MKKYTYTEKKDTRSGFGAGLAELGRTNIFGGLRESVARSLYLNNSLPQEFIAVNDTFGESGTPAQLMEKYKLNDTAIVSAVKKVLLRK